MRVAVFQSPFGRGWVGCRDGAVVELHFAGRPPRGAARADLPITKKIARYFAGARVAFGERVEAGRTAFATRVYAAVRAIPYGRTRTYGEIARAAGRPGAARAVGQLMGRNPACLVVP